MLACNSILLKFHLRD